VIRQQDEYDVSDDHFVYVTKDNVLKVVQRMLEVADIEVVITRMEDGGLAEPVLLPPPKDKTAAELMRRYRDKQRNGGRNDDRNTVTEEPELKLVAAE
jgi:hypothetical protein